MAVGGHHVDCHAKVKDDYKFQNYSYLEGNGLALV